MNKTALVCLLICQTTLLFAKPKEMNDQATEFLREYNGSGSEKLGVHHLGGTGKNTFSDKSLEQRKMATLNLGTCASFDELHGGIEAANEIDIQKLSKGTGYASIISLESVSPLSSSALKQLVSWANQLNSTHILSSEIVTASSGGLAKAKRAEAYAGELYLNKKNKSPILSRRDFNDIDNEKERIKAINLLKNNYKLYGDYDVADLVINGDSELIKIFADKFSILFGKENVGTEKEEIKSITGTIKIDNGEIIFSPPNHRKFISDKVSLIRKEVSGILKKIQNKLFENKDTKLEKEEERVLRSTHLPIGSLITLLTQYKGMAASLAIDRYSDLIAFESITEIVEEYVNEILYKAEALKSIQLDSFAIDIYIEQLERILSDLQKMKSNYSQKWAQEQQTADKMIQLDRVVHEKEKGL